MHPLPDPSVMEQVADDLVPKAYELEFDPVDVIFAEVSSQCFALAALLLNLLKPRDFQPFMQLSAHIKESSLDLSRRVIGAIDSVAAKPGMNHVIFLTSDPATLITMRCMADRNLESAEIEKALQHREDAVSRFLPLMHCGPGQISMLP